MNRRDYLVRQVVCHANTYARCHELVDPKASGVCVHCHRYVFLRNILGGNALTAAFVIVEVDWDAVYDLPSGLDR